jgi:putative hemin transport protein
MNAVLEEPLPLIERYRALQQEKPALRVRDAARELGVSEAELVAAEGAVALNGDWGALLEQMPTLGPVMALTRNESCVHERHGRYEKVEVNGGMALVLGPDIDLRLFLRRWAFGFACTQELHSGTRRSLQFFDAQGEAIQKVYLTDDSDATAYGNLVARFRAHETTALKIAPPPALRRDRPDAEIDVAGLRTAWQALRDTHDFYGMLHRFQVGRLQALRLAGAPLARPIGNEASKAMLDLASARQEPIMVFVANPGCIQIHTGGVRRIARKGPWLNILDEQFNLHLREDRIAHRWIVRKPTEDGMVTGLEVFDAAGELIVQFFGKRKPGRPEREGWRAIIAELESGASS